MNPNGLVVITLVQHIELGLYILRALRHDFMYCGQDYKVVLALCKPTDK